jgi:electron transfer flavoprotein alpha subunit
MGIADAKVVAAINTDSEAPIFKRCQFGIVEDWKKVIGPLTQRIDELL